MNFQATIWREPWLAPIAVNIERMIATDQVPSMGVTPDGKTLYYNPVYWDSLSAEEKLTSQLHELLHIANRHIERREDREKGRWNLACDISINHLLRDAGYTLPPGVLYDNMHDSAENIYDCLDDAEVEGLKERAGREKRHAWETSRKKSGHQKKGEGEERSEEKNSADLDAAEEADDGENAPEEGEKRSAEDVADGAPLYADLLEQNEDGSDDCPASTWASIEQSIRLAKKIGHGSTALSKLFTPIEARADWRVILQNYVKSVLGDDLDYLSYEFDEFGVCEDILSPKPTARICALVDESGSISDELYRQFLGELLKMDRHAEVDASGFTDGTELEAVPVRQYKRTMTGGTDVRHAYQQACKKDYDCIIVLTDGYLKFPTEEPVPTIWAMPQSFQRKMEVII